VSHLGSDVLLLWLVTLSLGASSAGLFAACLTIAFLANPVVLGVGLFLTPRLAAGFAGGGLPAVAELVRSTTRALALLLAVFVAAVAMAGERVLGMAYGPAYAGLGPAAASAAAAVALGALSLGPTSALTVIERPALNVAAGLLGLVAMLASAAILIPSYGVVGAGLSFCAANATQLVVRSGLLARAVAAAPRGQLARAELLRGKGTI
jgi:O-antigen/teichoic acid export membrane protein